MQLLPWRIHWLWAATTVVLLVTKIDQAAAQFLPFVQQDQQQQTQSQFQQPQFQQSQFQRPKFQNPSYEQSRYQQPQYQQPHFQQQPLQQQLRQQRQFQQQQVQPQQVQPYAQYPQYNQQVQPGFVQPRTAMAFQDSPADSANLPLSLPADSTIPKPVATDAQNQGYSPAMTGGSAPSSNGGSQNSQTLNYGPQSATNGYDGSAADALGSYGYGDYGCNNSCVTSGCCLPTCRRRWFGGVYGLLLQRDDSDWVPLAFTTTTPGAGYYPTDSEVVLSTSSGNKNYQGGAEVLFGSTLGNGGACGCCPTYGWEVGYWAIAPETNVAQVDDVATFGVDGNRTYGMMDFRGLEVNMGSGYRPVNSYYDYGPPVADHTNDPGFAGVDVEIRSLEARSTFSAQSIAINLLRLPILGGGSNYGGGCNVGGCDPCGGGCQTNACCGPRHSLTTLCGIRYLRFDDDFGFRTNFETVSGGAVTGNGFLGYNVAVDNHLVGFQMGCIGTYRLGCRRCWALHYGSTFGIYGNHMEVTQQMDAPTSGNVRFVNGTQSNFNINSSKDEVAFVGGLRGGVSYQCSCHCRLYAGWRVIAASGVALATSQIPTAFITPGQLGYIASDGSLFLQGLQAGVQWVY